jgi:hypothetical protein
VSAFVINPYAFFSGEHWAPDRLEGLFAWFDANDLDTIILDGTTVSQWRDKSAYGRHLAQVTKSKQATYSASAFLGKPTLQFDGIDDNYLSTIVGSAISSQSFTLMTAVNKGSVGTYFVSLRSSPVGTRGYLRRSSTAVSAAWGDPIMYNPALAMADNTFGLIGFNKGPDGGCSAYRNGQATNTIFPTFSAPFTSFNLGSFSPTQTFSNMWASELVLAVPALSTDTRQQLEGYLAHKWGLNSQLPAEHPYKEIKP